MSKYTTEVRYICETAAGLDESVGYNSVNQIIDLAVPKVFDFDFPIFDEAYRGTLCRKILKHYYTREIGAETVGLWKLWLDTRLNEIMPYYNELYKSALVTYNPLYDVDYTTEHQGNKFEHGNTQTITDDDKRRTTTGGYSDVSTGNGTYTRGRIDKYSDTPQDGLTDVLNDNYLTNVRVIDETETPGTGYSRTTSREYDDDNPLTEHNTGGTTTNGESDMNGTDAYTRRVFGKTPGRSYASLIKEFRETLLNIDMQVIDSLKDLFFNLW